MNILDNFAHEVLVVLAALSRFVLTLLEDVEGWLRGMMHGVGLGLDVQTVILIFILVLFLVGVMRLLGGRLRLVLGLMLILILVHLLAAISTSPLGGG